MRKRRKDRWLRLQTTDRIVRVRPEHIAAYWPSGGGTMLVISGQRVAVRENVTAIDRML